MSVATVLANLKAHSGLSALVSDRIYRGRLPQNPTYPLIFFRASEDPEYSMSGDSGEHHFIFEFECYAGDYTQLNDIKTQLKLAMGSDAVCTSIADDDFQDDTDKYSLFADFSVWF